MSPTRKYIVKCVLFGVSAALVRLQAVLPGISLDDLVSAVIAGAIVGLGYAGIGAATSLEAPGRQEKPPA